MEPDSSQVLLPHHDDELLIWITRPAGLRRSVELINEKLRGTKRLDLFECARVDPKVPVEESIRALVELKKEGKLDHIGMSECSADSLRRGNAVSGLYGYKGIHSALSRCIPLLLSRLRLVRGHTKWKPRKV